MDGVMSKKKRRKKYGKKRYRFIIPFCVTLFLVVLTGLFIMFAYYWITEDVNPVQPSVQLTKEVISDEVINRPGKEQADEIAEPSVSEEPEEEAQPGVVSITFAGDILFDANYGVMAALQRNGGSITDGIAPEVIAEMQNADIMMLNNEFPYSDRGSPLPGKKFTFRANPAYVSYLDEMGVDIVSLANNHAYDYGEEAFLDTMQILQDAGISYVGAGVNEQQAMEPAYFSINGIKLAILSATQIERLDNPDTKGATETSPGVFRCWNGDKLLQAVARTKENCDFLIVFIHWGTENEEETDWAQNKQAPELVEAGADLIIGAHPHILQKTDVIKGVPVVFSLGNFWFNSRTIDTGMVTATISKDGLQSLRFIPCLQSNCRTILLDGAEKERVLGEMRRMSPNVQIDADGFFSW